MKSRDIQTRYWTDNFISDCSFEAKSVYLYLLTCPYINISGIFQITKKRIEFDLSIGRDRLDKAITELESSGKVYFIDGWCWVFNAKKNNFNKYLSSSKNHSSFSTELAQVPDTILAQLFALATQNNTDFDVSSFKQPDTCIYTSINTSINRSMYSTHNHNHNNNHNQVLGSAEGELDQTASLSPARPDDGMDEYRNNPKFLSALAEFNIPYNDSDIMGCLEQLQKARNKQIQEEKQISIKQHEAFAEKYFAEHPHMRPKAQ